MIDRTVLAVKRPDLGESSGSEDDSLQPTSSIPSFLRSAVFMSQVASKTELADATDLSATTKSVPGLAGTN